MLRKMEARITTGKIKIRCNDEIFWRCTGMNHARSATGASKNKNSAEFYVVIHARAAPKYLRNFIIFSTSNRVMQAINKRSVFCF